MTLLWGLAQIGVALAALGLGSPQSIIEQVLTVAGFTTGMVLGLFLLGSLKQPVRSEAALAGLVAGLLAVLSVWLPSLWGRPVVAWPWYAAIGTTVTVAVGLLVDRLGTRYA
jgi:Na+/proline symporter